jgi:hypothetical protein
VTPMPFVYAISKSTGNGTMSDNSGKFYLTIQPNDTLLFSFVGYLKLKVPVSKLGPDLQKEVKIIMKQLGISLNAVTISTFKIKDYEREHMNKVISQSHMGTVNAISSPITALYEQFSKRGKEKRKLAQIYEQVLIDEQVQKKLNPDILRNLTGDTDINFDQFRKYCYYLSDAYILSHDGYDLYYRVMECYYSYKGVGH